MTHGDDDGLRLPPAIAPRQIVIVPMLRDKPEDAELHRLLRGARESDCKAGAASARSST